MLKFKIRNVIQTYIFICFTIIGTCVIFFDINIKKNYGLVILTFIINGFIILFELSKSSKLGYSLKEIFYLFMFIFMFISPLIQYLCSNFPWWDTHLITDERVLLSNLIIMLFMLVYKTTYKFFMKSNKKIKIGSVDIINVRLFMNILFITSVFCSIYIIANTGITNLFSRATNELRIESSAMTLIVSHTFRSVSVIYVAMNLIYFIKNKRIYKKLHFIVGVILMLLVNFPTATARFWMASVYLGLMLIIKRKFKNPHLFKIVIFIGILIVFPAINIFRWNTFTDAIKQGLNIPNPADAFLVGDFDSYSMLVRSIIYVDFYGIKWGRQLLGNILFFIPRKVWPNKPIGSGAMIATKMNWSFSNVSCPFIGEGYINFGFLGVILFAVLLAKLTASLDKAYIEYNSSEGKLSFIELVYPFNVGFLFFILRGDMLSSLTYYIGFMFPIILLYLCQRIIYKTD